MGNCGLGLRSSPMFYIPPFPPVSPPLPPSPSLPGLLWFPASIGCVRVPERGNNTRKSEERGYFWTLAGHDWKLHQTNMKTLLTASFSFFHTLLYLHTPSLCSLFYSLCSRYPLCPLYLDDSGSCSTSIL